jgi:peroxiredoxin
MSKSTHPVIIVIVALLHLSVPASAEEAPLFSAMTLKHGELSLADLEGKVVLLQFWASWCASCIANIPDLKAIYEEQAAHGFEIVGISLDETVKDARRAVAEHGISWPQICDGQGKESPPARLYGVLGTPRYILIDRKGGLAARYVRAGELEERLLELLAAD